MALMPLLLVASAHRRGAAPPTRLQHRLPSLNRVVPQHSSARLRYRVIRWTPVKRPQDHPLPVTGWCIGFELDDLLLLL